MSRTRDPSRRSGIGWDPDTSAVSHQFLWVLVPGADLHPQLLDLGVGQLQFAAGYLVELFETVQHLAGSQAGLLAASQFEQAPDAAV